MSQGRETEKEGKVRERKRRGILTIMVYNDENEGEVCFFLISLYPKANIVKYGKR